MLRRLALLLCVFVVSGCTLPPDTTPSRRVEPARAVLQQHLGDQASRLAAAEEVLVEDCMQVRGKSYRPVPPPEPGWGIDAGPLGNEDVADAREWGFGLRRQPTPASDPNRFEQAARTESEQREWDAALTGTAAAEVSVRLRNKHKVFMFADGCVAKAKTILYDSPARYLSASFEAQDAANKLDRATLRSSTYRRATRDWSKCMAGRGYEQQQTPQQFVSELAKDEQLTFAEEQRAAVTSAHCSGTAQLGAQAKVARQAELKGRPSLAAAVRVWDELKAVADQKARWVLKEAAILP